MIASRVSPNLFDLATSSCRGILAKLILFDPTFISDFIRLHSSVRLGGGTCNNFRNYSQAFGLTSRPAIQSIFSSTPNSLVPFPKHLAFIQRRLIRVCEGCLGFVLSITRRSSNNISFGSGRSLRVRSPEHSMFVQQYLIQTREGYLGSVLPSTQCLSNNDPNRAQESQSILCSRALNLHPMTFQSDLRSPVGYQRQPTTQPQLLTTCTHLANDPTPDNSCQR